METNEALFEKGDIDIEELVNKNLGLVGHILKNILAKRKYDHSYSIEDAFQMGSIGLWKAAKTYNPSKGIKFSTYAGRCIANEILMFFRKESRHPYCIFLEAPVPTADEDSITYMDLITSPVNNTEGFVLKKELLKLYEFPRKVKKRRLNIELREKRVYELMIKGYKQKEIGWKTGISQRVVANHYESIRNRVKAEWIGNA